MKIMLVSLQFEATATGGGGVHVKNICDQFLKKGHTVSVMSMHTEKTLTNAPVMFDWKVPYSVEKREKLSIVRLLMDEGLSDPYDGDKNTELDRIKRFADAAIEWITERGEEFDVINLHGHHLLPGYMAKELKGVSALVVSTIHALETTYMLKEGEFVGAFSGTKEVLSKIREWESMCRWADHIIVNSPLVLNETKEIIAEFDKKTDYSEKIILISSGCCEDFIMSDNEVSEKLNNPPEVTKLITFCRIDPSKGVEFSIRGAKTAAKLSPKEFYLTIAGIPASEEYEKQLRDEAGDLPKNLSVEFKMLKAISSVKERKEILDDKHIYILPTLKEPFGMSIIEASARGCMVVSADTNGPQFMFESDSAPGNEWGIITDYGVLAKITDDYSANLSENIGKAVNWTVDNWSAAREHVLNFNKKIRNTWTWESIADAYLKLFK